LEVQFFILKPGQGLLAVGGHADGIEQEGDVIVEVAVIYLDRYTTLLKKDRVNSRPVR
jgi:hypothetical protein